MKTRSFRKLSKRETLCRRIVSIINNGEVKPGDRLLPAREIAAEYQVNLRTALAALKELADQGLLDNVPRKGYFVRKDVNVPITLSSNGEGELSATTENVFQDPLQLLTPLQRSRDLSLYISDTTPGQLSVWNKILQDFRGKHPGISLEILTGNDGHIEDILQEQPVDVIHSSPKLLSSCHSGETDFIRLKDLKAVGIDREKLLPAIRRYLDHDYGFFGIPFSLETHLMYVNTDLMAEISSWFGVPDCLENLLPPLRKKSLMQKNSISTPNAKLFFLLKAGNGIRFPGKTDRIEIDTRKIREVLDIVAQSDVKLALNQTTRETPLFMTGKYPFLFHRLQMVSILHENVDFNWKAVAVPDGMSNGKWSDLLQLAIDKKTDHLHEALELVKHLCSYESQVQFNGLFGRVPILEQALLDGYLQNCDHISADQLLKSITKGEISPPFAVEESRFEDEINACGQSFQAGLMSAEEVIARIEFMYDYYFSQLLTI